MSKKSPKNLILPESTGALAARGVALALTLAPIPALADDGSIEVVARLDDPARGSTGTARALTLDDIGSAAPLSLLDALALLPGVDAFEKGGLGGGSYLALRGGEPNFTLVTINGVRVNDPMLSSGGGFDFSLIGAGDAGRIDVLSGPLSTAYGADALSGVVSVRLDAPRDLAGALAQAGFGSGGRWEVSGRAGLSGKAGSLALMASARDTADLLKGASSQGQSVMVGAWPRLGDNVSLDLFGFYGANESSGFPEDSGGADLAAIRDPETRERGQIALGATLGVDMASALSGQLRMGWSGSTFESNSPGIAPGVLDGVPPIVSDSRFERFEAVASLDWTPRPGLALVLGGSLVREEGTSEGSVDFGDIIPTAFSLGRTLPGLFATAALALPHKVELRAGLRADFPENGKTRITPRAGMIVPIGDSGLRLTASYAQGFKQPSLFALGFPLIANPDLLAERSRTMDAGIEWSSPDKDWQAGITAFRSVYRDLIDFDPNLFTNINRDRVTAKGVEFAASGRTGPFRAIASLTYMETHSADGSPLRFRPEWKGAGAVTWQASEALELRLDGRFSSGFNDSSVPTGLVRINGFATLDAQASFDLTPKVTLRAVMRNVTGERFYRTVGTPEPGRTFFVSLRGML